MIVLVLPQNFISIYSIASSEEWNLVMVKNYELV
jgi:hypothetical protein